MCDTTADDNDPLKEQRDEVFRKLGRNVVLFQQVEIALKVLLTASSFAGSTQREVEANTRERLNTVGKKTLGHLVGQFADEILIAPEPRNRATHPNDMTVDAAFGVRFSIDGDGYYERKTACLSALVKERNELVHHALSTFNLQAIDGLAIFDKHLEQQAGRIRAEVRELRQSINSMVKGQKQLADFLGSREGMESLELSWLQNSQIVALLRDIAAEIVRPDGWSVVQLAEWRLHNRAADEASSYTSRYGHKTLKALLLASEQFDLNEEPTKKGGVRLLYRPKGT